MPAEKGFEHSKSILVTVFFLSAVLYDYAYYFKAGLKFKDVPIAPTDYFHTILESIPLLLLLGMMMVITEFLYLKFEKGQAPEEVLDKVKQTGGENLRSLFYSRYIDLFRWVFLIIPIMYVLFGDTYIFMASNQFFFGLGIIIWWHYLFIWISSYERFMSFFTASVQFIKYLPIFVIFFLAYGYSQATIDMQAIHLEKNMGWVENIEGKKYFSLRCLEKGFLVFCKEKQIVLFIPADKIKQAVPPNKPHHYRGLLRFFA